MTQLVKPIFIALDRTRTVKFTTASVAALRDWIGVDLLETRSEEQSAIVAKQLGSAAGINAILAACLIHDDEDITPRRAGSLIDTTAKLTLAGEATQEAMARFMGVSAEEMRHLATENQQTESRESITSGPSVDTTST